EVLRAFTETVRRALRSSDLIARWGGDDFVLLLPDTPASGAEVAVTKLRRSVDDWPPCTPAGQPINLNLRTGVVEVERGPTLEQHLAKAERALFLGPDETVVVMGFVAAVIDNRRALVEGRQIRRRDLLTAIDSGASSAEVTQRLQEIRTAEQFQSLELAAAEQELRQLLTIEQEARFVTMGVLE
ncbi:diguanylate cyclase, partial [Planctomycetota bacterium]|nr:diguanylate cyclase [Planctomycetota bacterium]